MLALEEGLLPPTLNYETPDPECPVFVSAKEPSPTRLTHVLKVSLTDYVSRYQMTMARLRLAKPDALLMHPGPIIRGLELTWEVADSPQSVIVEEVQNGVPVRMAVLAIARGRARQIEFIESLKNEKRRVFLK